MRFYRFLSFLIMFVKSFGFDSCLDIQLCSFCIFLSWQPCKNRSFPFSHPSTYWHRGLWLELGLLMTLIIRFSLFLSFSFFCFSWFLSLVLMKSYCRSWLHPQLSLKWWVEDNQGKEWEKLGAGLIMTLWTLNIFVFTSPFFHQFFSFPIPLPPPLFSLSFFSFCFNVMVWRWI